MSFLFNSNASKSIEDDIRYIPNPTKRMEKRRGIVISDLHVAYLSNIGKSPFDRKPSPYILLRLDSKLRQDFIGRTGSKIRTNDHCFQETFFHPLKRLKRCVLKLGVYSRSYSLFSKDLFLGGFSIVLGDLDEKQKSHRFLSQPFTRKNNMKETGTISVNLRILNYDMNDGDLKKEKKGFGSKYEIYKQIRVDKERMRKQFKIYENIKKENTLVLEKSEKEEEEEGEENSVSKDINDIEIEFLEESNALDKSKVKKKSKEDLEKEKKKERELLIKNELQMRVKDLEDEYGKIVDLNESLLNNEMKLEEKLMEMQEKIEKSKDEKLCVICLDEEKTIAFQPCGHLCTCNDCSIDVHECPLCRKKITFKLKIFF